MQTKVTKKHQENNIVIFFFPLEKGKRKAGKSWKKIFSSAKSKITSDREDEK